MSLKLKYTIIKVILFAFGVSLILFWNNETEKEFNLSWKKLNNMNPVKCSISNEIDSIRPKGRGFFIKLDNGGMFYFTAKIYESGELFREKGSMIHSGDSVKKNQSSKLMVIKNRQTKDSVILELYDIDYDSFGCIE
ncbi:MAG: hypothetical protein ACQERC_10610 [Bacteroidota bacterium]